MIRLFFLTAANRIGIPSKDRDINQAIGIRTLNIYPKIESQTVKIHP
jgi:hypothetical protein